MRTQFWQKMCSITCPPRLAGCWQQGKLSEQLNCLDEVQFQQLLALDSRSVLTKLQFRALCGAGLSTELTALGLPCLRGF